MFASIRATRPYDQHLPYALAGDHYEAISDRPIDPQIQRWLDYGNRNLHTVRDAERLRTRLAAVLARAQARYPDAGIRGLRHYVAFSSRPRTRRPPASSGSRSRSPASSCPTAHSARCSAG